MTKKTDMPELLPCPFCGENEHASVQTLYGHQYNVWCQNCGADGPTTKKSTQSVKKWNTRADLAKPTVPPEVQEVLDDANFKYCSGLSGGIYTEGKKVFSFQGIYGETQYIAIDEKEVQKALKALDEMEAG